MSGSARLVEILRYPVKSMMGESLPHAELAIEKGLSGDRAWAIRDEVRGGIRGGKKIPELMTLAAQSQAGKSAPMITAPDGEQCAASDPEINDWLSAKLDHKVTLWPQLPADQLDHYRRGAPDQEDFEAELRQIFGREPHEPLPDLTLFAEVLEFESPPGTYFDAFPIHIMSTQSLATMGNFAPDSVFDIRRFRPNLLVDFGPDASGFPEQDWVGKQLQVGDAVLEVVGTCPRCSMTTHGFDDLPRDTEIMRHLVSDADGALGIYAKVVTPGSVAVDSEIVVL